MVGGPTGGRPFGGSRRRDCVRPAAGGHAL